MATVIRRRAGTNKSMQTVLHTGLFIKPTRGLLHKKGRVIKGASFNSFNRLKTLNQQTSLRFCEGKSHRVALCAYCICYTTKCIKCDKNGGSFSQLDSHIQEDG